MSNKSEIKNNIKIQVLLLSVILISSFGFSLAYFNYNKDPNDNASEYTLTTGGLSITYDGSSVINVNDLEPGVSTSKKITIKNISNYDIDSYNISVYVYENELVKKDELLYSLSCKSSNGVCDGKDLTPFPENNSLLHVASTLKPGETHTYELLLTMKDTGSNQDYNQMKKVRFRIIIGDIVDKNAEVVLKDKILTNNGGKDKIASRLANYTSNSKDENDLYMSRDQNGESYYFRGNVKNNYVSFAGLIWRIVRINGNGTLRIILDSSYPTMQNYNENISCIKGNSTTNDVNCVKYGIGDYDKTSISTIINNWYNKNVVYSGYSDYVANDTFCNDYSYKNINNKYIFAANNRVVSGVPSLICKNTSGYNLGMAEIVNGSVGLITVDEAVMATINESSYLYNSDTENSSFFTMSPASIENGENGIYYYTSVGANAGIKLTVNNGEGLFKPVINLKDTILYSSGDGTKNNPYTILKMK